MQVWSPEKARQVYGPTENTHDIFSPCYLPLYGLVALFQSPFLRLNNFHGRGVHNVYYLPELLYIFEGEVFDNEPPEFPSSDLTEGGEDGAEQTEFE